MSQQPPGGSSHQPSAPPAGSPPSTGAPAGGPPPAQQTGGGPPPAAGWTPSGPSGPRASFGVRLGAWLVDVILLGIVGAIVGAVTGVGSAFSADAMAGGYFSAANLINTLIGLAYYVYFEGSAAGQTVGKKLLNIRVIDYNTGGPLGYGKAALRYVGRILSSIPCGLGYFWMLWDKEKQTWHDKIATTVVVPTDAYPVQKWPG